MLDVMVTQHCGVSTVVTLNETRSLLPLVTCIDYGHHLANTIKQKSTVISEEEYLVLGPCQVPKYFTALCTDRL